MIVARHSFIRPFIFSLLVVSALSSKVLHLYQHSDSLPRTHFVLYFPTLFIQEALLFGAGWFLLRKSTGLGSILPIAVTALIAILTFVLSSSQIGFYFVTGSEVRWDAATSVGSDPEGRKLILSGLRSVLGAAVTLLAIAWLCASIIWAIGSNWMSAVFGRPISEKPNDELQDLPFMHQHRASRRERLVRFWTVCAMFMTLVLRLVRPHVPYSHMSGALPFTFFEALRPKPAKLHQPGDQQFPFPELIGEEYWEAPNGHFKGWAPGADGTKLGKGARLAWASGPLPHGFERWNEDTFDQSLPYEEDKDKEAEDRPEPRSRYNPVQDPLRISNLDHRVVEPLARALKSRDIPITHIMLVMMESARKDTFPFKANSHLYKKILSSYGSENSDAIQQVNAKLSRLTPIAEQLTGESSGLPMSGNKSGPALWEDKADPEMGGLNFHGILTGSSLSFKSAVMNHCGIEPLPVNFMDEIRAEIYQPCIMQILDLFNQFKRSSSVEDSHRPHGDLKDLQSHNWTSVFLQSITGFYDDQDVLNQQMGFKKTLYREDIDIPEAKYYHEGMEEINYFGYPEQEVYPYLRDVINDAITKKERLFLSHFTSTTHHPWSTPKNFHKEQYFPGGRLIGKHEDMNDYLNAVRYVDTWLGDFFQVLDDTGIANETLVVLVGDHGQAFQEDSPVSGTYENGHISNFRIPLIFRHPLLPRIQITANATSMSVVPTILDLLVQTKSLNEQDSAVALDLLNEYEGQSLIRPYQTIHNGRQAWNFGIINPGGTMLSVGSAAVPYRLILPLTQDFEFVFSNLDTDPDELSPLRGWSAEELISRVRGEHGDKAGQWVVEAEKVGRWWVGERKRLWNYEDG